MHLLPPFECQAWFHLNAASPAARNTEQVNITKQNRVRGRIRSTNTSRTPDYKLIILTIRLQLTSYKMELNVQEIYKYTIYK